MAIKNNKVELDFNEILKDAITETLSEISSDEKTGLMNIIDFCEHVLDMKDNMNSRPYFKLILKMWYMNTPANENLEITDEDLALIDKIDNYGNGNPWLKAKALKLKNKEITRPFKYLVACLGRRSGKSNSVDTPVLTPTGWKRMGDISVGDSVISQDGKPYVVSAIYPQGKIDIYRITFSDGSSTECSKDHLWFTSDKSDRKNKSRAKNSNKWNGSVKTTEQIMNSLFYKRKDGKKERNHQIPMTDPVHFELKDVPVDPYLFGTILGDAHLDKDVPPTACGVQISDFLNNKLPSDLEFFYMSNKKLGLRHKKSSEKFIPECYKFNSIDNRIAILQGILDTDGKVDHRRGGLLYCSTSLQLTKDVQFLVQSLGGIASIHEKKKHYTYSDVKKIVYELQIKLPTNIKPFRLDSKNNIYSEHVGRRREPKRFIESIEFIGKKEAQCISIEHPSHLYLVNDFIVTHNTYLSSVIQAYDVYKLLYMNICPKCMDIVNIKPKEPCPKCKTITQRHPQAYFGGGGSEPMRIILAATALDQAIDPGLKFFQERVLSCPLFEDKCEIESEKVFFRSEFDIERNKKFSKASKTTVTKGSIVARAIAANSRGIHGLAAVLLSFDEFALFSLKKSESDSYQDEEMMEALIPATSQFEVKHPEYGRVVMISAPQFRQGKFYESYKISQDTTEKGDNYLMIQMPTWEWCQEYTKEFFINQFSQEEESESLSFDKIYGAQFIDESENAYLPKEATENCFTFTDLKKSTTPILHRGFNYFMHIDCAYNTCNYAYCIVHIESKFSKKTNRIESFFVEDDSRYWTPSKSNPDHFVDLNGNVVDVKQIWDDIIKAARAYHVSSVSYDNMQTPESKAYFRRHGLPLKNLSFAGKLKSSYYGLIKNSIQEGRVACCFDDHRLRNELLNLRVKYTERGPKIFPNPNGIVKTMDVADCFVGACYMATYKTGRRMTISQLVKLSNGNIEGGSIFNQRFPTIGSL